MCPGRAGLIYFDQGRPSASSHFLALHSLSPRSHMRLRFLTKSSLHNVIGHGKLYAML